MREDMRKRASINPVEFKCEGNHLFICPSVEDPKTVRDLERKLGAVMSLTLVDDRAKATAFVVQSLSVAAQRVLWHSVLRGCYLVEPSTVLTGNGPCLKFKAALYTRRWVFFSAEFSRHHNIITGVI